MQQEQELNEAGWVEANDGSFQRIEYIELYENAHKPMLTNIARLRHKEMCRKGFITNNFEEYFASAFSFITVMADRYKTK